VTCDFRDVQLKKSGENRVSVTGAKGRAPTDSYKVSATYQDGFRCSGTMMIGGRDAVKKAEAVAAAILKRTRRMFEQRKLADYLRTDIEVLGSEANWGANSRAREAREVILKLSVHHADKNALEIFGREFIPPATAMAQGITGFSGGRPSPTPLVRLFSCLVPKSAVSIEVDGAKFTAPETPAGATRVETKSESVAVTSGKTVTRPLIALAYGRSGDKGDTANIGVLARKPEYVPVLRQQLTADAVKKYLAHFARGKAERFEIPGLHGFNFLMQNSLGGGGMASLRYDPQGKMLAQILMDFPIEVPESLLA
jgi:hypothetical protein